MRCNPALEDGFICGLSRLLGRADRERHRIDLRIVARPISVA